MPVRPPEIVGSEQAGPRSAFLTGVFCSVNCTDFEHSRYLYHVSKIESAARIVLSYHRGVQRSVTA